MLRIRSVVIATLMLLPSYSLHAQNVPANLPEPRVPMWREIRAACDSMEAAFDRGDMLAVARFYSDDAKIVGVFGSVVEGRPAIDQYWMSIANPKRWRLEISGIAGNAALASHVGKSHLVTADANGRERTSDVDFVVIWKRQPNGALRIAMDLY